MAQYLTHVLCPRVAASSGNTLRWAIAGRNAEKLEALQRELQGDGVPAHLASDGGGGVSLPCPPDSLVVADASDGAALSEAAGRASVVVCAAGPFIAHGEVLAASCVDHGTDYCDTSGETPFMRNLADRFHERAASTGVTLVPGAGFDSAPADLGNLFSASALVAMGAQGAREVRSAVEMEGKLSGGTTATGIELERRGLGSTMRQPWLLGGAPASRGARLLELEGCAGARSGGRGTQEVEESVAAALGQVSSRPVYASPSLLSSSSSLPPLESLAIAAEAADGALLDAALDVWTTPFMMSHINTRVVRRTSELLREAGAPLDGLYHHHGNGGDSHGDDEFGYNERLAVPAGEERAVRQAKAAARFAATDWERRQAMVDAGRLPGPGTGPNVADSGAGFTYRFAAFASGGDTNPNPNPNPDSRAPKSLLSYLRSSGMDPGYAFTAACVSETSLLLLSSRGGSGGGGGGVIGGEAECKRVLDAISSDLTLPYPLSSEGQERAMTMLSGRCVCV